MKVWFHNAPRKTFIWLFIYKENCTKSSVQNCSFYLVPNKHSSIAKMTQVLIIIVVNIVVVTSIRMFLQDLKLFF